MFVLIDEAVKEITEQKTHSDYLAEYAYQSAWLEHVVMAVKKGDLPIYNPLIGVAIDYTGQHPMTLRVKKSEFDQWLNKVNGKEPPNQTQQTTPSLLKSDKQLEAIVEVIKLKGFDPMQIPDGEKGTIEAICKNDYPLLFDSESSFHTAWKKGRHLFRMANHDSYARRGKK